MTTRPPDDLKTISGDALDFRIAHDRRCHSRHDRRLRRRRFTQQRTETCDETARDLFVFRGSRAQIEHDGLALPAEPFRIRDLEQAFHDIPLDQAALISKCST